VKTTLTAEKPYVQGTGEAFPKGLFFECERSP